MPPLVRPSASMSLVSTQKIFLTNPCVIRSRTEIKLSFKLDSAGPQISAAAIASHTAVASAHRSNGAYTFPLSNESIIRCGDRRVPRYIRCNAHCNDNIWPKLSTNAFNSAPNLDLTTLRCRLAVYAVGLSIVTARLHATISILT